MDYFRKYFLSLIIILSFFLTYSPHAVFAEESQCRKVTICNEKGVCTPDHFIAGEFDEIRYEITVAEFNLNRLYRVTADGDNLSHYTFTMKPVEKNGEAILEHTIKNGLITWPKQFNPGNHKLIVRRKVQGKEELYCLPESEDSPLRYVVDLGPTPTPIYTCSMAVKSHNKEGIYKITPSDRFDIFITTLTDASNIEEISAKLINRNTGKEESLSFSIDPHGAKNLYTTTVDVHPPGHYTAHAELLQLIVEPDGSTYKIPISSCSIDITICDEGCGVPTPTPFPSPTPTDSPICRTLCYPRGCDSSEICLVECALCRPTPAPTSAIPPPDLSKLCNQLDPQFRGDCWNCIKDRGHIWTAIGCLPTDLSILLKNYVFVFGLGIAGGISFIFFLYGTFLILVSMGNPEKIEQGKQIIISALSGLLFIIFSVFILRVIGIDILRLPGFS